VKIKTSAAPLVALLLASVTALAACGSDDSTSSTQSSASASGNRTDRAFVAEMIPHHRSAVQMAKIAQSEGDSEFVKTLADNIVRTQNQEIATMRRIDAQLSGAGVEKGELGMDDHTMGMDTDADMLEGAKPFDAKFIEMMVPHHEGAIEMAKVELDEGKNAELRTLAKDIISAQEREVKEMNAHEPGSSSDSMDDMDMDSEHDGG
jgi:uncharacterized protein (DUF305 family)